MQTFRQSTVLQAKNSFNQARHASCPFSMSNVGFYRANMAGVIESTPLSKHGGKCSYFNTITHPGTCTMRFHILHLPAQNIRITIGLLQDRSEERRVGKECRYRRLLY